MTVSWTGKKSNKEILRIANCEKVVIKIRQARFIGHFVGKKNKI